MTRLVARLLPFAIFLQSCATLPYHPRGDVYPSPEPMPNDPQIERGSPVRFVDGLGNYLFSLPEKLVLWNERMGRHKISATTEDAMREFIARNELKEVKVRLNEYDPIGEWHRLTSNYAVGAGWRYTFGILNWAVYTILPGRLFGGDNYNPYTNTVSLYSDLRAVALHELGHAKDTAGDKYKGSWAALRLLPLWPLRDEAVASNDAVSYIVDGGDKEQERRAYKLLYPAYGTYIGGEVLTWIPGVRFATLLMAIPGHIVGRIKASNVEDCPTKRPPEEKSSELSRETPLSPEPPTPTMPPTSTTQATP